MSDPVNYRVRDTSAMDRELEYALSTLKSIRYALDKAGKSPVGLNLLELGPGSDFGGQLILASMGCNVTLADRFISRWDPAYHPIFYRRLCERWDGPKQQLEAVLRADGYTSTALKIIEEPAERLASIETASIDFVYSCAVLEHIQDIGLVAKEMFRIMKPTAAAYHQIDFRDHRNFAFPLDHLMMSDETFEAKAEAEHYEFGNRLRSIEFWNEFEANGLRVLERYTNDKPTRSYLSTALASVRRSKSVYRYWPEQDLQRTSAYFLLSRMEDQEITVAKERASDTLDLISALKSRTRSAPAANADFVTLALEANSMTHSYGELWIAPLPGLPPGDNEKDNCRSRLELFEDSFELSPSNSIHDDIAAMGKGRFSHWNQHLFFSTSDNSSPLENGRRYSIRYPSMR